MTSSSGEIAVVIPCYQVAPHLLDVLARVSSEVARIYCVIDGCPGGSEAVARLAQRTDDRIVVLTSETNHGVGHAFKLGCVRALDDGYGIIVKLDGDGQMPPESIPQLVAPLLCGEADYAKGNRFFHLEHLKSMPWLRLIGNAGLSFLCKLSSGYWNLFDPTNGFLAIDAGVARQIPWQKVNNGYFFESDMLFHLSLLRAVVVDVPMPSRYEDEVSSLSIAKVLFQFPPLHLANFLRRLFYCYFLRDFHAASLNLVIGLMLISFGTIFGLIHWIQGYKLQQFASAGTVMFAAMPVILGWQALLSFLAFDVSNVPKRPLQGIGTAHVPVLTLRDERARQV